MASLAPFTPVQPRRSPDWVPAWKGFFGERLKNTVYGWPEPAFDTFIKTRRILGFTVHIITDPDAVQRVLLDNSNNYIRPRIAQRILSPLVGNGLLAAEGDHWRTQRKIVAPTFAPGAVAKMTELIAKASARHVATWSPGKTRIDMARMATDTTMSIIADALFSGDKRLTASVAGHHIDSIVIAGGQARFATLIGLQNLNLSPVMRRARKGRVYLRETLTTLVRERGPSGGGDDFFGGLIRALYEQFPPDEAESLAVDNAVTFYVAGHETTANALAWTIYLLAAQPELQEAARAEAIATSKAGEMRPDAMPLLRAILEESMRLYPPAPRFDREAVADDELCGQPIGAGDLISIWPWVIHRHRKLWDNPDVFDHTRFLGEVRAAQHRFQYIPFGGGTRVCVGMRFAMTEALIILSQWLTARRFSLPNGFRPDPAGSVTLRPRGGMPLWVEPV